MTGMPDWVFQVSTLGVGKRGAGAVKFNTQITRVDSTMTAAKAGRLKRGFLLLNISNRKKDRRDVWLFHKTRPVCQ